MLEINGLLIKLMVKRLSGGFLGHLCSSRAFFDQSSGQMIKSKQREISEVLQYYGWPVSISLTKALLMSFTPEF